MWPSEIAFNCLVFIASSNFNLVRVHASIDPSYNLLAYKCRLKVFENRFMRRIFGLKRDQNGGGEGSIMRNFIVCTVHLI